MPKRRAVPRSPAPPLQPAGLDAATRGVVVGTSGELGAVVRHVRGARQVTLERTAAGLGVSENLLRGLERAARGTSLAAALTVLAGLGLDVVLVPRDPAVALRRPGGVAPVPGG